MSPRRHPCRRLVAPALLAAAFAALFGCAALTIDVDVYKGPLVNDVSVQVEQVSSLAMGAKPLLIELRDRLEAVEAHERRAWQLGEPSEISLYERTDGARPRLREIRRPREAYAEGYIRSSRPDGAPLLQSEQARRVNGVLSLYEDAEGVPQEIRERVDAIVSASAQAAAAMDVLQLDARPVIGEAGEGDGA